MRKIITLSRQFGSGGRELGKRLSEALGIPCYDHQIIDLIADEHGLDKDYVAGISEKVLQTFYPATIGRHFTWNPVMDQPMKVAAAQNEILRKLAEKEDCMIVGRCADVILKDKQPLKLYVYADMDARVQRCMAYSKKDESLTESDILKMIKRIDRERSAYRSQFTDIRWGNSEAFNLCINTTGKEIKELIDPIVSYVKVWFGDK